jgi:hypothetical protein
MSEVHDISDNDIVFPETTQQQGQQIGLNDLKVGYVVGLTEDEKFVFEVVGKKPNLAELLGLHKHAETKLEVVYSQAQFVGDAVTVRVGEMVGELTKQVAELQKLITKR